MNRKLNNVLSTNCWTLRLIRWILLNTLFLILSIMISLSNYEKDKLCIKLTLKSPGMNSKWWSPRTVSSIKLKDCSWFSTRDSIKTEWSGCGMSDLDCIKQSKELKYINGTVLICETATCSWHWLYKTKNNEKTTSEDKPSKKTSMLIHLMNQMQSYIWNMNSSD